MAQKWNEKWLKNANCEQPYYIIFNASKSNAFSDLYFIV